MNGQSDSQLLAAYLQCRSESAFGELVRRHLDLVYSSALRMLGNVHSAKDVTQGVFIALAQNARQLATRPTLAGWLHCTTRNLAAKFIRSEVRRRAREQEAVAMSELHSTETEASWGQVAVHLDEALGELEETSRDALLLRFFKNQDLRTIGAAFGISDDAAQKRVSRAVEHLRECLVKRGVAIGAGGLGVVISANAVHAVAPDLALTISTTAVALGTSAASATTIAMTTLQKVLIGTALAAVVTTGVYQTQQVSRSRAKSQVLEQQEAGLTDQIERLRRERDRVTEQMAALRDQSEVQTHNQSELLRLRGEVARLRREVDDANRTNNTHPHESPEAAGAVALPIPTEAHPLAGRALVKWDNALLLGQVITPTLKTAALFAIPKRGDVDNQLRIDTRLVVLPDGFVAPHTDGVAAGNSVGVLSNDQTAMLLKVMNDSGARILSSPSVSIQSGGEAQIEIGGIDQTSPAVFPGQVPTAVDSGSGDASSTSRQKSVVKFAPTISTDGDSVDLAVETWFDNSSGARKSVK